jgi:hypothetical protein
MSAPLAYPPPIPRRSGVKQPVSSVQQSTAPVPDPCACVQGAALTVQRGADLSTKLTLTVTDASVTPPVTVPVDVTGNTFQFTAKTDPTISDDDPSTIKIDWPETATPTQGITWLKIPAATTQNMQVIAYAMQIRMKSASGVVTPLVQGTLTVTQPISARF